MESVTQSEIRLEGAICFNNVEKIEICIVPNEHGTAKINVIVGKEFLEMIKSVDCTRAVKILSRDTAIFCGIIQKLNWQYEGTIIHLEIELFSMSVMLDNKYKKRSFQNCKMSVCEIIKEVSDKSRIKVYAEDQSIDMPTYQFNETDWQFMRRLTSKLGTCIYPDVKNEEIVINIGLDKSGEPQMLDGESYECGVSSDFFSDEKLYGMVEKSFFIYYQIESYKDYDIGQKVMFKRKVMNIIEKKIYIRNSEVIYKYKMGSEKSCFLKQYSNLMLSGLTLSGRVIATKNQCVKIHLDIDEVQKEDEAYWYEWVPETGNIMYCMPQKGTSVRLYFKDEREKSAIAVSCVRENGALCEKMSNTADRYFSNEFGKEFYLKEKQLGLINESDEIGVVVDDILGISLKSGKMVNIISNQTVSFKANKIVLNTPTEIKMIQG